MASLHYWKGEIVGPYTFRDLWMENACEGEYGGMIEEEWTVSLRTSRSGRAFSEDSQLDYYSKVIKFMRH